MKTILIVEDDKKTSSLVALYLEKEGFNVMIAHDGHEGLSLAERHHPILVILDLMLPKLDGWEVCRQIRRISDVPVIMLTARGEEVDRISGLTLGADDYVTKPFSPRELVARVKAVLRRGRLFPIKDTPPLAVGIIYWHAVPKHSGIALMTPEQVHYGLDKQIYRQRCKVLADAFEKHPNRFKGKRPVPKLPPAAAWINKPTTDEKESNLLKRVSHSH